MKSFRFKYSQLVWALLLLVFIILLAGVCWNIYTLIANWGVSTTKTVTNFITLALTLFLLVFVISIVAFSKYTIKNGNVIVNFGFIKTKTPINEIVQFTHFKKSDKLVVYFKDAKYSVIVISKDNYQDFVLAVREHNHNIIYDNRIEGEE